MLTIQNIDKIRNKTLGKKNFYIENVKEVFDLDPLTNTMKNHRYQIDITNRKYAKTLMLYRSPIVLSDGKKLYKINNVESAVGWDYLVFEQIQNMDKFLDRIRYHGIK